MVQRTGGQCDLLSRAVTYIHEQEEPTCKEFGTNLITIAGAPRHGSPKTKVTPFQLSNPRE